MNILGYISSLKRKLSQILSISKLTRICLSVCLFVQFFHTLPLVHSNKQGTTFSRYNLLCNKNQRKGFKTVFFSILVCIGTNGRMVAPANREHHYRNLRDRYTNCTYVDGNLELTWLQVNLNRQNLQCKYSGCKNCNYKLCYVSSCTLGAIFAPKCCSSFSLLILHLIAAANFGCCFCAK